MQFIKKQTSNSINYKTRTSTAHLAGVDHSAPGLLGNSLAVRRCPILLLLILLLLLTVVGCHSTQRLNVGKLRLARLLGILDGGRRVGKAIVAAVTVGISIAIVVALLLLLALH